MIEDYTEEMRWREELANNPPSCYDKWLERDRPWWMYLEEDKNWMKLMEDTDGR